MIAVHSQTRNSHNHSRATRSMCYDGCSPPGGDGNNPSSSWNRTTGIGSRDITSERPSGGVASIKSLWPSWKKRLNVHFLDGTKRQRDLVRNIVNEHYLNIPMHLKIRFLKHETYHDSDIRITFQTTSSESYLGRDAEKHLKHFVVPNSKVVAMLVFMPQAKGMTKLVQDGGLHVQTALLPGPSTRSQVKPHGRLPTHKHGWDPATVSENYDKLNPKGIQYDAYDPDSIMHYPIERRDTRNGMSPVFQNCVLSEGDEELLMDLYPLPGY